jgi:biopolymer transport protein ExbB/TolQ
MPVAVQQAPLHRITPLDVFAHAESLQKVIIIALLAAAVAALVVLAQKLRADKRLPGGSAFLSGLRLGGPILGGLGACLSPLNMSIGYATVPGDLPLKVLAPGFAEAFFVVGLGFLAGAVAVFANWIVESRIDHSVLKA